MIRTVGFAYAGARIQARYGRRVPQTTWERLRRLATSRAFVQGARDTALRPWLAQVDPDADAHQVEAQLRALFRRRVRELAGWAPAPWRPAIDWVAVLPDLPAINQRLDRGEGELPEPLRAIAEAHAAKQPLAQAWLLRWRGLWPPVLRAERRGLEQLVMLLQRAAQDAATDAPAAEAALLPPLHKLFRRHTRAPAGLFAYLALTWMEFSELRGALARRRLALPLEGARA